MNNLNDLLADLDRIEALPARERAAERVVTFHRVELVLRQFVNREAMLLDTFQKAQPALRELSIRLMAMKKQPPDAEMLREYNSALARAFNAIRRLQEAAVPIIPPPEVT